MPRRFVSLLLPLGLCWGLMIAPSMVLASEVPVVGESCQQGNQAQVNGVEFVCEQKPAGWQWAYKNPAQPAAPGQPCGQGN
jgi:hypothetical protein